MNGGYNFFRSCEMPSKFLVKYLGGNQTVLNYAN